MELHAPPHWHCIDFISDLHLQAADSATWQAWVSYLQHTCADAVFVLGDLFEVWVGDDLLTQAPNFESHCVEVLRDAAQRLEVFIMAGNRDFLMGPALMQAAGASWLDDPCVLTLGGERWTLSHGDALCVDDSDYLQFRAKVRSPQWQSEFLSQPVTSRLALARQLREQSQAQQKLRTHYADVDTQTALDLLQRARSSHLLHGHTHRPANHALPHGCRRVVLSDWDLAAAQPRAEVLRLTLDAAGTPVKMQRLTPINAMRPNPAD